MDVFEAGLKRALDLALSVPVLIVFSPLWALIAILVKLDSPGPILFVQERVGKDGKRFLAYKFRTMVQGAVNQGMGFLVERNDPRITRVGRFLRRFSLDEAPQLINVFKDEMSLVGPRPTLAYQVEQYDDFQRRRLQVKPGITGWAQIHGRNLLSWPERIEYDVWYIEHWSLWLDIKTLLLTPIVVIRGQGIYGDPEKFVISPQGERRR